MISDLVKKARDLGGEQYSKTRLIYIYIYIYIKIKEDEKTPHNIKIRL